MIEKKWKDVEGFSNYEIHPDQGIRRRGKESSLKGRNWIGYPKVTLMRDGKKHERRIHKLVAEHFIPNPENHPIVNHIDSDRSNHGVKNLEWMNNSGNQLHRWKTEKDGTVKKKYVKEYDTLAKIASKKKNFTNIPCEGKTKSGDVSCGRENKTGLASIYTHRARSSGYDKLENIPLAKIKFIGSTG